MRTVIRAAAGLLLAGQALLFAAQAPADDKATIDANTSRTLAWLQAADPRLAQLLREAAGVLVFPDVVKMGFGVGGEFGEGALLVGGQTEAYYATAGTEFGLAPEAGYKSEVIFFMTEEALRDFRSNSSWKIGEHVAVPVITGIDDGVLLSVGDGEPLLGLILSGEDVVSNLQLHGDRITRIAR